MEFIPNKLMYGLLDINGNLLKIRVTSNEGGYACGSHSYKLDEYGDQYFLVDSVLKLSEALAENTPWYNTTDEKPGWGEYTPKTLGFCKVELKVQEVEKILLTVISILEARDWSSKIYEPQTISAKTKLVWILSDYNLEEARKLEGTVQLFNGLYTKREIYKVLDVPQEYVGVKYKKEDVRGQLIEVEPKCVLICSPVLY